ncbi:hypothetical protein TrST_g231 [Triparma strigata]|uniref:Uncharacterized protein n=1 Tax=Triparma strigata TaxID=1606541 RepID=A0A9W7ENA2_9STRA|nr:hypothetical protein TrST_g231 [Triparma strigata]
MNDIEMGITVIHGEKIHPEENSEENEFREHIRGQVKSVAAKTLKAEGADAKEAVNTEALSKLMDGGGVPLERLNIAINYLQNFGLVLVIDIPWPESFKKWWTWVEALGLDFNVFGGMGEEISIVLGLLVPAWLVWEFDAGLFWERMYFGFVFMNRNGEVLKEGGDNQLGFALAGLMQVVAIVLSCVIISEGWITNNLVNAFLLVLSGLSLLSFLHQVYLWRETKVCKLANEDFAKKRQQNQMFFFLFFYTVAYLSGVSACTKLMVAKPAITDTYFYCENRTLTAEQIEPEQRRLLVESYNTIMMDSSEDAWDGVGTT